jgi:hypothetical protein
LLLSGIPQPTLEVLRHPRLNMALFLILAQGRLALLYVEDELFTKQLELPVSIRHILDDIKHGG